MVFVFMEDIAMSIFKDFSYRLLRTFALTTGFTAALLLYMAYKAIRGNTVFLIAGLIMLVLTVLFTYLSWNNYKHRPVYAKDTAEVYGSVCPKCGEMLKVGEVVCPNCQEKLQSS